MSIVKDYLFWRRQGLSRRMCWRIARVGFLQALGEREGWG